MPTLDITKLVEAWIPDPARTVRAPASSGINWLAQVASAGSAGMLMGGALVSAVATMPGRSVAVQMVLVVQALVALVGGGRMLARADVTVGPRGAMASRMIVGWALLVAMGFAGFLARAVNGPAPAHGAIDQIGVPWLGGFILANIVIGVAIVPIVPIVGWLVRVERGWVESVMVIKFVAAFSVMLFLVLSIDGSALIYGSPPVPLGWAFLTHTMIAVLILFLAAIEHALRPWSTPERWRAAHLGSDRLLTFADGSPARQASPVFGVWQGDVVVIPTAVNRGGAFRGDEGVADGWVIPGTIATLGEAVRASKTAAWASALALLMVPVGMGITVVWQIVRELP